MYEDRKYLLYIHENKINGKVYVGITSKENPEKRWLKGNGYKGSYFYNAIQKYGWDGFEHKVLFRNLSQQEAFNLEKRMISDLKANDRKYGYNIADGGNFPGEAALKTLENLAKEREIKVVRLNDGKIYPSIVEAEKDNNTYNSLIVKVCKKQRHNAGKMKNGDPIFWSYWNENLDVSKELEQRKILKNLSKYKNKSQKVVCINTGEVFLSLKDAENKYGVWLENIIKCCKHKYDYAGKDKNGFPLRWMYYFDYITENKETIESLKQKLMNKHKGRAVKCIEDGNIFYTLKEAAMFYGINNSVTISQQLRGRIKNIYIKNKTEVIHFCEL